MAPELSKENMALICLTSGGLQLARRLQDLLPGASVFAPVRLLGKDEQESEHGFDDFSKTMEALFRRSSALICIMAAGIVVRTLAPWLVSKYNDPPVLVIDEAGQYIISLLSGHRGGANQLAREIAAEIGAQAVITTATDVRGSKAVDSLAMEINAIAQPDINVKLINRSLAEGQSVAVYSPWSLKQSSLPGYDCQEWTEELENGDLTESAVLISPWLVNQPKDRALLQLLPRNLFAGIGCRKGVSYEELRQAFNSTLKTHRMLAATIAGLASIDIKNEEPALLQLSRELELPLFCYTREELAGVMEFCEPSERVFEKIGVHGVCEPAALLASGMGIRLLDKQVMGPVTISIAMEKSWWWDWDQAAVI